MSTAAAAQAAIQQAIKASGAIVKIEANDFSHMLSKMDDGLVIEHQGKLFFKEYYQYSTSYKGFVFYCKSSERISIPSRLEKINAKQIWVPQ
tara:strand:+ start:201 stop:476 length:276 start_codon:yes stop_codon:yes gene_type:complete